MLVYTDREYGWDGLLIHRNVDFGPPLYNIMYIDGNDLFEIGEVAYNIFVSMNVINQDFEFKGELELEGI